MKVKNKILLILISIIFISFFIIGGLYLLFEREVSFIWNNIELLSFQNSYEEKNRKIDILSYDINIELFPDVEKIYADTRVTGVYHEKEKKQIALDFHDNFDIHKVQLDGKETDFSFNENQIIIDKNNTLADSFEVRIIYEGTPKNLGFGSFNFNKEGDHKMIYTLNEPIFASTWFPCNDTPSDKAELSISITNDSGMVSVSNGKLISIVKENDKITYNWKTVYPISTYLIALYSAPYKTFSQQYLTEDNDTMNIDYYVLPEKIEDAHHAFDDHLEYLKVFSNMFGEYPFVNEKYGIAQISWTQGAMESQTITGVGTNFISRAKFFSDMLIHEVAHHWWGNAVTPKTWKDIWLSEGFATYSEALFWERTRGNSALISTMESFNFSNDSETLYDPNLNIFSQMIYNKGAWVLHMLRREIGDTLFFKTLENYYQQFKYKNADTFDFKTVCENTSNINLDKFFDQWVFSGKGIIEVSYNWEVKTLGSRTDILAISLSQIQEGYNCYSFPIDISIEDSDGNKYTTTSFIASRDTVINIEVTNEISSIEFDHESWLLGSFTYFGE